jgi:hypothetical protein
VCFKIVNGFHYVNDPCVWGFCHACLEYFLEKGQRLLGKAYAFNQPSFELDVKSYKKIDYPLDHYGCLFGFNVIIVICLQSIHTSSDEYIMEFFLPPTCVDSQEQEVVLNSFSITMQRVCPSLRTVSESNSRSLKISTNGALVSLNTDERLENIKGDPQIVNLKSLNGVEIKELGQLIEEGNFVFTWAWMLLKSKGLTRGEEQARRQFGLMLYIQQYFTSNFKDATKR